MLKFLLTGGADGIAIERAPLPDAKKPLSPSVHTNDILAELLPAEKLLQASFKALLFLTHLVMLHSSVHHMSISNLCTVVRARLPFTPVSCCDAHDHYLQNHKQICVRHTDAS